MAVTVREGSGAGEVDEENVVAEINITPLTDIFLVLLIIFMVTSSALVDSEQLNRSGLKVNLPTSNAAGPAQTKKTDPVVTVTKGNEVYIGPKKTDFAHLEEDLRKALADGQSETVLVRGDMETKYGNAVDIMSIAKRAGATRISVLTASPK